MGADAAGAAGRRRGAPVPAAEQQGDAARPACARLQGDQVHQLRLREVRRIGRAQAADRQVGERSQLAAAMNRRAAQARRALHGWLLLGLAGFVLLPWYLPQNLSLLGAMPGVFGGSDTASGLVQAARHQRPWLWIGLAGLLVAA